MTTQVFYIKDEEKDFIKKYHHAEKVLSDKENCDAMSDHEFAWCIDHNPMAVIRSGPALDRAMKTRSHLAALIVEVPWACLGNDRIVAVMSDREFANAIKKEPYQALANRTSFERLTGDQKNDCMMRDLLAVSRISHVQEIASDELVKLALARFPVVPKKQTTHIHHHLCEMSHTHHQTGHN